MRMMGQLTEKMRLALAELEGLESWVDSNTELTNSKRAKHYVCIAHDWLAMDFEDRAVRIFIKANKTFPGYFHTQLEKDAKDDPKFALLSVRIMALLISLEVEGSGLNH